MNHWTMQFTLCNIVRSSRLPLEKLDMYSRIFIDVKTVHASSNVKWRKHTSADGCKFCLLFYKLQEYFKCFVFSVSYCNYSITSSSSPRGFIFGGETMQSMTRFFILTGLAFVISLDWCNTFHKAQFLQLTSSSTSIANVMANCNWCVLKFREL